MLDFIVKDEILYFNGEKLIELSKDKSNYILRQDGIINVWNTLDDNIKLKIGEIINDKNKIDEFVTEYISNLNIAKLTEQEQLKHITLLISLYVIHCYNKSNGCIFSGIDLVLKRFPNIYIKIMELFSRYQLRYREIINRLEYHSLVNTAENELFTILRDLFVSALMEEKYLYKEIGFGLINNIFARLFMITGSKKAGSDTSYRDINYDFITLKTNDLHDIIINNTTLNYINNLINTKQINFEEFKSNLAYKINPTFINFVALPYINEKTNLYLTRYNITDEIIYSVLYQYLKTDNTLNILFNTLGRIQGPELTIYDNINVLKQALCGVYYDVKTKVMYFNDINHGFHKYGPRTLQQILPNYKELYYNYSIEPFKLINILAILLYAHHYDKQKRNNIVHHYIKFIDSL